MEKLIIFLLVALSCRLGDAYSKYGRTCMDIACPPNEVCEMKEDPCTLYSNGKCGRYPTCQRDSNAEKDCKTHICPPSHLCKMDGKQPKCFEDPAYGGTCMGIKCPANEVCIMKEDCKVLNLYGKCRSYPSCQIDSNASKTCETYVACPPTQICKMDGGQPKCFEDPAATGNTENKLSAQSVNPGPPGSVTPSVLVLLQPNYPQANYPQNPQYYPNYPLFFYNSNYPQNFQFGVYFNLPGGGLSFGHTTPRSDVLQPGQGGQIGSGDSGGQIGSGYPGQSGYPQQSGGYLLQGSGYPQQSGGYPQQGGGYPQQGGGYPQQGDGYPQQGGYPNHSGYPKNVVAILAVMTI